VLLCIEKKIILGHFPRMPLLQPLRWCCVDCVIHHERDEREEQHHTYMWREQAMIEWSWHVNSIVACCHSAKLCAHAARDFRSQHPYRYGPDEFWVKSYKCAGFPPESVELAKHSTWVMINLLFDNSKRVMILWFVIQFQLSQELNFRY